MAYEPKTWECGEVITADALNHLEQGVAQGGGGTGSKVVHIGATYDAPNQAYTVNSADATYAELQDALSNGEPISVIANVDVIVNGSVVDNYTLFTSVGSVDKYSAKAYYTSISLDVDNRKQYQSFVIDWAKDASIPTITMISGALA